MKYIHSWFTVLYNVNLIIIKVFMDLILVEWLKEILEYDFKEVVFICYIFIKYDRFGPLNFINKFTVSLVWTFYICVWRPYTCC